MMRQRLITSIIMVPALVYVIRQGGVLYTVAVVALLTIAAWEYTELASKANTRPPRRGSCTAGTPATSS